MGKRCLTVLSVICVAACEGFSSSGLPAWRRTGLGKRSGRCQAALTTEEATFKKERRRKIDLDFLTIAAPALVQFTAEPLASLVDAIYLGRLDVDATGGAGVAIGIQYSFAKLANDPLLRTSISLVAAGSGAAAASSAMKSASELKAEAAEKEANLSAAVSTALLLATAVGLFQVRGR